MADAEGALGLALFEDRHIQDPYPLYERMHAHGPLHRIGDSTFYAVTSWDAVVEATARCSDFSSNLTATMVGAADGTITAMPVGELGGATQVLATADDPAHAAHRKALLPQLAAKRIRALGPFITETTEQMWRSGLRGGRLEWMETIANRIPMMIVGQIIGVPDEDIDKLIGWGYAATQFVEGLVTEEQLAVAGTAVMELAEYITAQFSRASSAPGDNLLGDLAAACSSGSLDDSTATIMMITLFSAAGESTASLIGSAAWILASRPDIQRQLRENPALLNAFLEEVLRYEPPFRGHYRHVVADTDLGGVHLAAGSRLILLWGAANRDPAHFDHPDEFRLDRPSGRTHLAFGKGAHFCVGAALARLEATMVLDHLLKNTISVDAAETGRWLPSLLVRRLERLELAIR